MRSLVALVSVFLLLCAARSGVEAQEALKTPLPDETLQMLANEVSGQLAFNNVVKLAGAERGG